MLGSGGGGGAAIYVRGHAIAIPNAGMDYSRRWAPILRRQYGTVFSIARRPAGYLTVPGLLPTLGRISMKFDERSPFS